MITEYKPEDTEALEVENASDTDVLTIGEEITVATWNVGYLALGDNADFFMDGGSSVYSSSEERVNENLSAVIAEIDAIDPDLLLLQETDRDSSRSYHIEELMGIVEGTEGDYSWSFANNFRTLFVPYPIPPIGKVDSGIATLSKYEIDSAERVSLPCPFSWPVSMVNLKRCLDVSRIPVEGSDKELVLINLHLEAYDNGEGKIAQTKMLSEIIQAEIDNGNYVIAGGDFNQVFSSVDSSMYPVLEDKWQPGEIDTTAFDSSLQFLMDTTTPTCRSLDQPLDTAESTDPEDFQYYMLDGFIVSGNLEVSSVETLDLAFENSDHNPVVMQVTLK